MVRKPKAYTLTVPNPYMVRNTISKLNLVDLAGSERNDSEERSQVKVGIYLLSG